MRKKILILGHNDATQFIDIFNQYTQLFDRSQFEVTVAYLTGKANPKTKERTLAERVIFLDVPKKDIRSLKILAIKRIFSLCRQEKFQIVICHRYKPTYLLLWVAQFIKIPSLIFVMHELNTMASFGRQCVIGLLKKRNMLFAGVSNAVRDDIRRKLWSVPKERVITLYNMIDLEETLPKILPQDNARKEWGVSEDEFIFGSIGRLEPNKDQASLIHAFSIIKPFCLNAKLILIGDGSLEAQLKEQVIAYGLEQSVLFTGFVPEAFRYLSAFDCFVLPSVQEAFGRVLLESMAAKLPIIATKVHGIPEVISESGFLIEPGDRAALANAMQEIYQTSPMVREGMGLKAFQRAVNHFSIPKFVEQFWQLPLVQSLK